MFCRSVRKKLSAFLQGELESRAAHSIEAHLAKCSDCRNELEIIQHGIQMAERLPVVTAPEDLWQSVEERIPKQKEGVEPRLKGRLISRFALAFSIFAVISLFIWLYRPPTKNLRVGVTPAIPWNINATVIEACSCPTFCQCYFNQQPAAHAHNGKSEHFCRGNLAYQINKGKYGSEILDGVKFWLAADFGSDFSQKELLWAVLYFDPSLNMKQREAIQTIFSHLMPVKWKSFRTDEAKIDGWEFNRDTAYATLDAGKTAIIKLRRFQGITNEPVVFHNLRYWGAPRNDGFVLMPNEVEAYRVGPKAFEFAGTSGFMINVDMNSDDLVHKNDQVKRNSPTQIQPSS
jgi:Protein of unknown function (DUF1326)/Putative zinc-finger